MKVKLNRRLKKIAECVPPCRCVADIGTDHAYLPAYLTDKGICQYAVASDIKNGPVARAHANISRYGNEKVEIRKGYGLSPLAEGEADAIVISGMGGMLIAQILKDGIEKIWNSTFLVLQPMQAEEELRRYLWDSGFEICQEKYAKDRNRIYVVMLCRWTGKPYVYDSIDIVTGKNRQIDDENHSRYIELKMKKLVEKAEGLKVSNKGEKWKEIIDLLRIAGELESILKKG